MVIQFPAGESLRELMWPVNLCRFSTITLTSPRDIEQKRSHGHLKEYSSYRTMKLSLEMLRYQRTFVLGISFAVLLVLSQQNRSHIKVILNSFSSKTL